MPSEDHAAKLCTVAHEVVQTEAANPFTKAAHRAHKTGAACKTLHFVRPSKEIVLNRASIRTRIVQRNTPDSASIAVSR